MELDLKPLQGILDRHPAEPAELIAVLQDIQVEYSYLPPEALKQAADALALPLSKVYSVATFYSSFSLKPKGKKVIRVCLGTACHVRGAGLILDELVRQLKVNPGETTECGEYTLESVNCVGTCAMAPVVMVNEQYYGKMRISKIKRVLR
jgi:NADH:ubiquinone oxidoreductase subunit E